MRPGLSSRRGSSSATGLASVRDILDGKHEVGSQVSLLGIVTDFRAPIATRGMDWKCQIRIFDRSVEDDSEESILLNVFRPEKEMPEARCGDAILIFSAKVQKYNSETRSLCTSWTTDIHIYEAAKIPKPPGQASAALRPPLPTKVTRQPSSLENERVSVIFHSIDKSRVPTEAEFEVLKVQSLNVQNKFSELKDVRDGKFADCIVQIVKDPYDMGEKFTLWVSDYTENPTFFHYTFKGGNSTDGKDGDRYRYQRMSEPDWTGPFGKRSMQVTCYEPHASVIREQGLSINSWLLLRNLQIKYGSNGANLEGYLREDRGAHGIKINVTPLFPLEDPESIDPRLKDAIRRKRDYEREKKQQLKSISEAAKAGLKRKANMELAGEPKQANSKARRVAKRAEGYSKGERSEAKTLPVTDLNSQVKCEYDRKPASTVAEIIDPILQDTIIGGQPVKLQLPFVNLNYRTNVRVVNFEPSALQDFACKKPKTSEITVLSDNDDSDVSGSESEEDTMAKFTSKAEWEWRFYLQLEDAVVAYGQKKKTFWALVDNQAAQNLINLDAADLRLNHNTLDKLRQRLFLLWGDLEEHKSQAAERCRKTRMDKDGPPADSSDEEAPDANGEECGNAVVNRPFSCCIRQYGIKVAVEDESEADAGCGRQWQRMFGLFGAKIAYG